MLEKMPFDMLDNVPLSGWRNVDSRELKGFMFEKIDEIQGMKAERCAYTAIGIMTWCGDMLSRAGCLWLVALRLDDIIVAGSNKDKIEKLKALLNDKFKLRDLANLKYFLGLDIARSKTGISTCQTKYILQLLEEYGVLVAKPSAVQCEINQKLTHSDETKLTDLPITEN
ncbi:Reverse transcriptase, RNA-dependent DNA polymerase [Dillenia turbinata]|uniref:Reverse transcriptase, RNA-dependent DNA polymerase n=1 Tax=Dillenia turbinata TaxID=194707 RepID=A0AAN8VHE3_9MAGN